MLLLTAHFYKVKDTGGYLVPGLRRCARSQVYSMQDLLPYIVLPTCSLMRDSAQLVGKSAAITDVPAAGVDGQVLCLLSAAGVQVEED